MEKEVVVAIIGAAATVAASVISVLVTRKRMGQPDVVSTPSETRAKKQHRFDVFVSAPLAALATDEDIAADHDRIAPIVALLEGELGFTVYWAGRNIRAKEDFEAPDLSAKRDVDALLESKYFLLLYPERVASSVLFEAGVALRECITSVYFVRDMEHLPFLMTHASQAFSNVRSYKGNIPHDLVALLHKHGVSFFDPQLKTPVGLFS